MKRLLLVFAFMFSTSFVLLAQNSERKVTDIVLKSVIGYDGQPITSGYVYGLDISKGLPLKITDDGATGQRLVWISPCRGMNRFIMTGLTVSLLKLPLTCEM